MLTSHTKPRLADTDVLIMVGNTAFTFETVEAFLREARVVQQSHPELLMELLMAFRNNELPDFDGKQFPSDHRWVIDQAAQMSALAFCATFYRLHAIDRQYHPKPIADAIDKLGCRFETHREMLRLITNGLH